MLHGFFVSFLGLVVFQQTSKATLMWSNYALAGLFNWMSSSLLMWWSSHCRFTSFQYNCRHTGYLANRYFSNKFQLKWKWMAYHFAISPIEKQILVWINQKDSCITMVFWKNIELDSTGKWRLENEKNRNWGKIEKKNGKNWDNRKNAKRIRRKKKKIFRINTKIEWTKKKEWNSKENRMK